ncbi:MAG: hypothetical protein DWH91_06405 [Planctomycetota bacterium]|nr:MAG: hypothetical protein DWH91_06405 [Planctomycetota bacterium]
MVASNPPRDYLIRYGVVPEVARCQIVPGISRPERGAAVVVQTHRGPQLGEVLGDLRAEADNPPAFTVLRTATATDLDQARQQAEQSAAEFADWTNRIAEWNLDLQLIDIEWTLDGSKRVLYVLNERGPECTRLAIQAAASGFGIIEVQPVGAEGLISQPEVSGGGCGTGGCGCSH